MRRMRANGLGMLTAVQVQVVEIGKGAFKQVVGVKVPKAECKVKEGDRVSVMITGFRGLFSGMVALDGVVELVE